MVPPKATPMLLLLLLPPLLMLPLLPATVDAATGFNCSSPGSGCSNAGNCTTATGLCTCPTDKLLPLEGDKCEQVTLLTASPVTKLVPSASIVASAVIDLTSDANFRGGIPLSQTELATRVYVCSNGYITFNTDFCTTRVDLLKSSWTPPFVAAFATSFDYRKSVGSFNSLSDVSYALVGKVADNAAVRKIRDGIAELANATAAIVFTWSKTSPPSVDTAQQEISFQLILFTDFESVTGAVSLYPKPSAKPLGDYFDWLPTLIGSRATTDGAANLLAGTRTNSILITQQPVSIGSAGATSVSATARLTLLYRGAGPNYRLLCLNEADVSPQPAPSTETLGWCPRSLKQATSDVRFARIGSQNRFNLILSSLIANSTQITCAYDTASGGLLATDSFSNITASIGSPKIAAKLYEYCCDRVPNLCGKYYSKLPTPTSDKYQNPSAIGFVTGNGELRSFDGQVSRLSSVGDFWLLKTPSSNRLSVQVRLSNTNAGSNWTSVVTGCALKFTGALNYSTEFYWNSTTKEINVNNVMRSSSSGITNLMGVKTPDQMTLTAVDSYFTGTKTSLFCFISGSSTWITAQSSDNGLTISVFVDKANYFSSTAGLLGNYDDNRANDVAFPNGTTGISSLALESWRLGANDSLFDNSSSTPTAQAGWTPFYWLSAWTTNQTLLVQTLFGGNGSIFAAANQTCAATQASNSMEYQNCLIEYSACGGTCATAYLNLLTSTAQQIADFTGCTAANLLQWNANLTEVQVTEGTEFRLNLTTLISGVATFAKVSGPADLTVNQTGWLVWVSPSASSVNITPIVVSASSAPGCASLVQLSVRLTRTSKASGVCDNSVEDFTYLTSPAGESYRRDKIYPSVCKCNANYYTANCSMSTCPLDCYACNSSVPTSCTGCPANYAASEATTTGTTKLAICAYTDRCASNPCNGSEFVTSKPCRSVDPALQTSSLQYQCVCASGYEYPDATNKTACRNINECLFKAYCDTSLNQRCTDTVGSYICDCSPGYSRNVSSGVCTDINECLNTGICPNGQCVNTLGSYYCNCSAGYVAANASSNCTDIDECQNPALSGCQQNCTNTPGSFSCSCFAGFGSPPTCPATTACTNSSICAYPNLCSKLSSVDTCACPTPATLNADKRTCTPSNYCASNPCGTNGNCTELNPGYGCSCKQYYELNAAKICIPIDYCGRRSMYPSVCPTGNNVVCSVNATTNEPTCQCATGFTRSSADNTCVDVDECRTRTSGCDSATTDCANLIGSWLCKCKFGYKKIPNNSTHCTPAPYPIQVTATFTGETYKATYGDPASQDFLLMAQILEKRMEDALPSDGLNVPTFRVFSMSNGSVVLTGVASYNTKKTPAEVTSGATSSGLTAVASLLNECLSNLTNDCLPAVHDCIDTVDGYTCKCKSGYTQTGTTSGYAGTTKIIEVCTDIDECLTQCRNDTNKVCVNLPGSYTCSCIKGMYSANATTMPCEDPCIAGRCKNSGQCQYQANDQFPYRCVCLAGYTGFHCELLDDYYWGMQRNAIIIGVVLGALLLICLVIVIIFLLRRCRSSKNRADFYQSNFSDNQASHSGGTYKGVQSMAMSDTSIPRAQHSAHHPSTYENQGYERETHKTRTDYF